MENVVSNIKAFRMARGMTRRELANKVGVTEQAIGQYENCKRNLTIDKAIAIYKALGIKLTLIYEIQEGEI